MLIISTHSVQGVGGPSQIRYVNYLEEMLYLGTDGLSMEKMYLDCVHVPVCEVLARRPRCVRACQYVATNMHACIRMYT